MLLQVTCNNKTEKTRVIPIRNWEDIQTQVCGFSPYEPVVCEVIAENEAGLSDVAYTVEETTLCGGEPIHF